MKDAMQEDLIEYGKNPFDRYAFKTEPANIEYLSEAEISAFEEVHLTAESRLEQHRDLYVFACYAGGIRVGDLLRLQWKNFNGESIALITSKTNDPLSIKLGSVALAIVQKQNGRENSEGFIFGLLPADLNLSDRKQVHTAISRATAYLNKNLKIIARKAGINKNIHFHTSRHTWATRALRKGMKYELMSKLLTHRSLTTSQRYAKIVNADLDKAMDVFND
jgi:integrase/recombinase XerD